MPGAAVSPSGDSIRLQRYFTIFWCCIFSVANVARRIGIKFKTQKQKQLRAPLVIVEPNYFHHRYEHCKHGDIESPTILYREDLERRRWARGTIISRGNCTRARGPGIREEGCWRQLRLFSGRFIWMEIMRSRVRDCEARRYASLLPVA